MASLSFPSLLGLNLLKCLLIEWDLKGERGSVKYATHHLELEATGYSVTMLLDRHYYYDYGCPTKRAQIDVNYFA